MQGSTNTNTLTVNHTPTTITVNPVSGSKGDIVNLIATLTDTHNNVPIAGKSIQFSVNGNIVGTATTNTHGIATHTYTITQNPGTYTILAEFLQDLIRRKQQHKQPNSNPHTTALVVNPVTGYKWH